MIWPFGWNLGWIKRIPFLSKEACKGRFGNNVTSSSLSPHFFVFLAKFDITSEIIIFINNLNPPPDLAHFNLN